MVAEMMTSLPVGWKPEQSSGICLPWIHVFIKVYLSFINPQLDVKHISFPIGLGNAMFLLFLSRPVGSKGIIHAGSFSTRNSYWWHRCLLGLQMRRWTRFERNERAVVIKAVLASHLVQISCSSRHINFPRCERTNHGCLSTNGWSTGRFPFVGVSSPNPSWGKKYVNKKIFMDYIASLQGF